MTQQTATYSPPHELSNAMVGLHRELFGRGPAEAKSTVSGGIAVCMMSDVYTALERRLIEGGREEEVINLRLSHQRLCEDQIKRAAAEALRRPVLAALSSFHVDPDLAVEVFLLGRGQAPDDLGAGD
jgi:uncharacterized protein YbcI